MSDSFCDPIDCNQPGSSVHHGILRAKYWNELPFPSPGYLPDPGIEPASSIRQVDSLYMCVCESESEIVSHSVVSNSL